MAFPWSDILDTCTWRHTTYITPTVFLGQTWSLAWEYDVSLCLFLPPRSRGQLNHVTWREKQALATNHFTAVWLFFLGGGETLITWQFYPTFLTQLTKCFSLDHPPRWLMIGPLVSHFYICKFLNDHREYREGNFSHIFKKSNCISEKFLYWGSVYLRFHKWFSWHITLSQKVQRHPRTLLSYLITRSI